MRLVEIIRALKTSEETTTTTEAVAHQMKKETVRVKDVPGFLVNRVNAAFRAECYQCLLEGVASLEDIDKAIKLGLNHPMGPFELADFVGLEIGLNVFKTLYEGYKDPKFRPPLLLEKWCSVEIWGERRGRDGTITRVGRSAPGRMSTCNGDNGKIETRDKGKALWKR